MKDSYNHFKVYGLGANALNPEAVANIFKSKGRPSDNPLIVHISSIDMLHSLLPPSILLPHLYKPILEKHWPGPLTILIPKHPSIPDSITAGHSTVAVRMPAHPVARALIEACGFPIAAPSANTSGRPSPTRASHVLHDLNSRIPLILGCTFVKKKINQDGGTEFEVEEEGYCDGGVESTVLDAINFSFPVILRPGGVTFEQIKSFPGMESLRVHKKDYQNSDLESAPTTPGMKYR